MLFYEKYKRIEKSTNSKINQFWLDNVLLYYIVFKVAGQELQVSCSKIGTQYLNIITINF